MNAHGVLELSLTVHILLNSSLAAKKQPRQLCGKAQDNLADDKLVVIATQATARHKQA
jgi:hypothetical protein